MNNSNNYSFQPYRADNDITHDGLTQDLSYSQKRATSNMDFEDKIGEPIEELMQL